MADQLSESEYVAEQIAEAQVAMRRVAADLTRQLGKGIDPRQWAKAHPWYSVAGAAVAGFAAASAAVPSKEEQARRRLAAIERALHPRVSEPKAEGDSDKSRAGFMGPIVKDLIGILRPVLMSAISAGLSAVTAAPDLDDPDEDHDAEHGQPPPLAHT